MNNGRSRVARHNEQVQIDFYKKHSNVEQRWRLTRTRVGILQCTLVVLVVAWLMWFGIISLNGDVMAQHEFTNAFIESCIYSLMLCPLVYFLILQRGLAKDNTPEELTSKRLYTLNTGMATLDVIHDEERRDFPLKELRPYKSLGGQLFRFEDQFLFVPSSPENDAFANCVVDQIAKEHSVAVAMVKAA